MKKINKPISEAKKEAIREHYLKTGCTYSELQKKFGIKYSSTMFEILKDVFKSKI